jgi:DNA-binding transcriptional MerR regulator
MDFEEHKKRQERARALGMDYARIREIITGAHSDDEDSISMGRAVEEIRELALQAVEKAIEEERKDVTRWLRLTTKWISEGEHRKEEKS